MIRRRSQWVAMAFCLSLGASPANAQDSFQEFFFDVCDGATGGLEARCDQTPRGFGDLSSDSEASLNPSQAANLTESGISRARAAAGEVEERLEERRSEQTDGSTAVPRFGAFMHLRSEFFDREETSRERGYDGEKLGGQVGLDYRVGNDGFVGVLLSFDRSDSVFDSNRPGKNFVPPRDAGGTETEHYSVTLYGSTGLGGGVYADGSVGYGHTEIERRRRAVFQESRRVAPQTNVSARGKTDGDQFTASGAVGWETSHGAYSFGPYSRIHFAHSDVDGYTERGASGLAMKIDGESQASLAGVVGVRGGASFSTSFGVLVPQIRLEYEHEFLRDSQTVGTSFVNDPSGQRFTVRGDDPDRDYFNVGVSVLAVLPGGWMPFVDYEALLGHSYLDRQRVTLGIRKEF